MSLQFPDPFVVVVADVVVVAGAEVVGACVTGGTVCVPV